ncbi:MAG: hypothetical protein R2759_17130 [Bacteroidales bacterium]
MIRFTVLHLVVFDYKEVHTFLYSELKSMVLANPEFTDTSASSYTV